MIQKSCWLCVWLPFLLFAQDPAIDMQLKYQPDDWSSYSVTRNVLSMAMSQNYVYLGTEGGILPYDRFREKWDSPLTVSDGLADQTARILAWDRETGTLWCINRKAVSYYVTGLREWRNLYFNDIGIQNVIDLGVGREFIWVQARQDLIAIDRELLITSVKYPDDEKTDAVQWVRRGRDRPDIDLLDFFLPHGWFYISDGHYFQDMDQRQFPVNQFMKDRFFHLFVATEGMGLGLGNLNTHRIELKPHGPWIFDVSAMAWDGPGVWLGGHPRPGEDGGISWWNMEDNTFAYFHASLLPGLNSDHINAIAVDSSAVWFGTDEGLARYHRESGQWRMYMIQHNLWGEKILSLCIDGSDLWIGTDKGLNRMHTATGVIERESYSQMNLNPVYWVEPDGDTVWAGSAWGAFLFRKSTGRWQTVAGYPGIQRTAVPVVSAWDGQVWFGTDDGIEMYDHAEKSWRGFPDLHFDLGQILSILADNDVVWAGTADGLVKYVKPEDRWHRYTTDDGLLHNRVQRILPDGNHIWLATPKGVTRFFWNAEYRID